MLHILTKPTLHKSALISLSLSASKEKDIHDKTHTKKRRRKRRSKFVVSLSRSSTSSTKTKSKLKSKTKTKTKSLIKKTTKQNQQTTSTDSQHNSSENNNSEHNNDPNTIKRRKTSRTTTNKKTRNDKKKKDTKTKIKATKVSGRDNNKINKKDCNKTEQQQQSTTENQATKKQTAKRQTTKKQKSSKTKVSNATDTKQPEPIQDTTDVHVFPDTVTNEELHKIVQNHYESLFSNSSECLQIQQTIYNLQKELKTLKGFHTIHRKRDIERELDQLQVQLTDLQLDSKAYRFKTDADVLLKQIARLSVNNDLAIVEGLASNQTSTTTPMSMPSIETTDVNENNLDFNSVDQEDHNQDQKDQETVPLTLPRRRKIALAATRTIAFGNNDNVTDATDTNISTDVNTNNEDYFRELLLDDLRCLMNPQYVRPAYRVSEEECSLCKSTMSFVSGQSVLVCNNPTCQQEQKASTSQVGFGNQEHMSMSSCRYEKLGHFAKKIKQVSQKLNFQQIITPPQFYHLKEYITATKKQKLQEQKLDDEQNLQQQKLDNDNIITTEKITIEETQQAIIMLNYESELGQHVETITQLLNYKVPVDFTPEQRLMMLELFMITEPHYEQMQKNDEVNGRVNTLNHNGRGTLHCKMFTFGDKFANRFKKIGGPALKAEQENYFRKMTAAEGYTFV